MAKKKPANRRQTPAKPDPRLPTPVVTSEMQVIRTEVPVKRYVLSLNHKQLVALLYGSLRANGYKIPLMSGIVFCESPDGNNAGARIAWSKRIPRRRAKVKVKAKRGSR